MNKEELGKMMVTTSEEALNIITSTKGLLILAEHSSNPAETRSYLALISSCVMKLEEVVKSAKDKIQQERSRS